MAVFFLILSSIRTMQLLLISCTLLFCCSWAQISKPRWKSEPLINIRGFSPPASVEFSRRSFRQNTPTPSRSTASRTTLINTPAQPDAQLASAVVDMALEIGRISADPNSPAEVFSPVSIMGVLNILLLAADGVTRAELYGALRVNDKTAFGTYHRRAAGMLKNMQSSQPITLDKLAWKAETCISNDYDYEDDGYQPPVVDK